MGGMNEQLRTIAVDIGVEAAEKVRRQRLELTGDGELGDFAASKSSPVDPVTIVDTMAEDFISEALQTSRPDDGIIGEEGAQRSSLSGISWVVDPIDGTVNFLYGIPHYAVSIAAARDGAVVAGAVVNVANGDIYSAARGEGATVLRGGEGAAVTLHCSTTTQPEMTLLATGFSYSSARRTAQAELLQKLLPQVRDIRRMGSAALDLCSLAEGRVDAYFEHGIQCWDFAAGALIAEEAGAAVDTPALSTPGAEGRAVFAAAGGLESNLGEVFREARGFDPIPSL